MTGLDRSICQRLTVAAANLVLVAACTSAPPPDDDDDDGATSGSGGSGGAGAGPSCALDPNVDPDGVLQAILIEEAAFVASPAPTPFGTHPSVTNGGCTMAAVDRGEQFIVPFAFTDTDTPVSHCFVTITGASTHHVIDKGVCEGGLDFAGDLPLTITLPVDICPGSFTLGYAAGAQSGHVSQYLVTTVQVSEIDWPGGAAEICPQGP